MFNCEALVVFSPESVSGAVLRQPHPRAIGMRCHKCLPLGRSENYHNILSGHPRLLPSQGVDNRLGFLVAATSAIFPGIRTCLFEISASQNAPLC